jgi:RimJ/RimL family protein N-acetyltransferase
MSKPYLIESERLIISSFKTEDISMEYISWLNNKEINKYSNQRFIQHTYNSSRAYLETFSKSNNLFLSIKEKNLKKNIGTLTAYISIVHQTADIGILIGDVYFQKQGYGLEAWKSTINFLFENDIRKITAGTLIENIPMIKIFENSGMHLEGVRKKQEKFEDKYIDIVQYAKFKK